MVRVSVGSVVGGVVRVDTDPPTQADNRRPSPREAHGGEGGPRPGTAHGRKGRPRLDPQSSSSSGGRKAKGRSASWTSVDEIQRVRPETTGPISPGSSSCASLKRTEPS